MGSVAGGVGGPPLFHGSRTNLAAGTSLSRGHDGFAYVASTDRWADAFAYRDAVSAVLNAVVIQACVALQSGAAMPTMDSAVSRVKGYVHTVTVAGPVEVDPDFPHSRQSFRTAHPVTVASVKQGSVQSWREFHSIVGPYKSWVDGDTPFYDADGYVRLLSLWQSWGYTADDLRALGKWYPAEAVWEDKRAQALLLVSEFTVPLWAMPASGRRDDLISKLGVRMPLRPDTAAIARTEWWQ